MRFKVHPLVTLACLLLAAAVIWSVAIEPRQLFVNNYVVTVPNLPMALDGMRIALVTDIHVGALYIDDNKVRQIVDRTNAANPDIILLLGDFVCTGRVPHIRIEPETFAPELSRLKARQGVYSVLGNHDCWYNGEEVRQALLSELGLTDEQLERVAELKLEGLGHFAQLKLSLGQGMKQIVRELSSENIDKAKVKEIAKQLQAQKNQAGHAMVDRVIAFAEVLTPEQRKKLRLHAIKRFLGVDGPSGAPTKSKFEFD